MTTPHENFIAHSVDASTIESPELFQSRPDAQFAVGMVAVNGAIINGYRHLFDGASHLRAGTYLEKGFVTETDLDENGTELDHDDERSAHFVVVEQLAKTGLARIVANVRLVNKQDETPLPIERYFPEHFADDPIPVGGAEISRLISRHESPAVQSMLKWPLFASIIKYAEATDVGPTYGVMTPILSRALRSQNVPVTPIGPAKRIEEIHATKQPLVADLKKFAESLAVNGDMGITLGTEMTYLDFSSDVTSEEVA